MLQHMFSLPIPLLEKILRPAIVYVCLIIFLRLFGKRELAQLNPFDLVVLLSLSNTVQNAIIGEDNSLVGGIVGALALLSTNWLVNRGLFHAPKVAKLLQGERTILIRDGVVKQAAMDKEILTHIELMEVLHKQGIHSTKDVKLCALEPSGNFYLEKNEDALPTTHFEALSRQIEGLMREVHALKVQLAEEKK
jgi:uncharacterized membrane protein YcaP (DUF421 family)